MRAEVFLGDGVVVSLEGLGFGGERACAVAVFTFIGGVGIQNNCQTFFFS
jgi:hypothetical protein